MAVTNGQIANANTFNTAFISRTQNSSTVGKITLQNSESASVTDTQKEHNSIASFVGKSLNSASGDLPVWPTTNVGATGDDLFERVKALDAQFPIPLPVIRVGSPVMPTGTDMVTGTFSSPLANAGYSITFSFSNVLDSDPIFLQGICVLKATTHFIVKLNTPADSVNYKLEYKAVLP